jgi:tetratricopeptide (TPR) repeat protein
MNQHDLDRLLFFALRNLKIKAGQDVYFNPDVARALEKAARKKPGNKDVLDARLILDIRNHHKEDFSIAVRNIPDPYDQPKRSEALYLAMRAGAQEISGETDAAIADYSKLLQIDSGKTWGLACRGKLYMNQGDFGAARQDLELRAKLQTDAENQKLAQAALTALAALENCEDIFDAEFDAVPAAARQQYLLARETVAAQNAGKREQLQGLAILDTALRAASGTFPRAHTLKALIYDALGNIDKAIDEVRTALEQSPYEFDAQALLAELAVVNCPTSPDAPRQGIVSQAASTSNGFVGAILKGASEGWQEQKSVGEWERTVRSHLREVTAMVDLFSKLCSHGINDSNFISFAETMSELQDKIEEIGLPFPPQTIPQAILNVPDGKIFYSGEITAAKIAQIRLTAQGELMRH